MRNGLALASPVLPRSLLVCDAGELAAQRALNLFRMPFAAGHATDVRAVHIELTRDSAVETTQGLHVAIQQRNLALKSIGFFHSIF